MTGWAIGRVVASGAMAVALMLAPAAADPGGRRLPDWTRPGTVRPQPRIAPLATAPPSRPVIAAALVKRTPATITLQLLLVGPGADTLQPAVTFRSMPHRVVLDIGDVAVARRDGGIAPGAAGGAAVAIGLAAPARVQAVLTLPGPWRVVAAEMAELAAGPMGPLRHAGAASRKPASRTTERGRSVLLSLTLAPANEASFAALVGPTETRPAAHQSPPPSPAERRVVVIDAGHGGGDPGAVASDGTLEKTIVLAVAKQVRAQLEATGRYRVVMTRDRDVFVPLERRVDMSQTANADVFVSLHADSAGALPGTSPEAIRGASIYTLSDRASGEDARRLAERENAADHVAGQAIEVADPASDIREILIDLTRAETQGLAADLRNILVAELKRSIAVAREPVRAAAFRVLRQTRTPSVLIELGYMTNARDQAQMTTADWQRKVAASIVAAIDRFLSRTPVNPAP